MSQQIPTNVTLGSDAYWALESTKEVLRANVATSKKLFLKTLGQVKKSSGWNWSHYCQGFTRAIIVFLPGNLGRQHSREFRALFLSWVRVRQRQPKGFKTDLIVVTPEESLNRLMNMGCTKEDRNNNSQGERCIIRLYKSLLERKVPDGTIPDPLTQYPRFIDSILCLAEYDGHHYDAVMRSDLDTLLMPGFANWTPPSRETLLVGQGGYGHNNANAHLKYVSEVLGLDIKEGLNELGSTWFGDTGLMVASARPRTTF